MTEEAPLAIVSRDKIDQMKINVQWHFGSAARLRRTLLRGPYCSICGAVVELTVHCPHPEPPPNGKTSEQTFRPTSDFDFVPGNKELASALNQAELMARTADSVLLKHAGGDTSAYYALQAIAHIRAALAEIDRQSKAYRKNLIKQIGNLPPWLLHD